MRVCSTTRLYALQHAGVAASALAALIAAAAPPGSGRAAIAVVLVACGAAAGVGAAGSSLAVERHFVKALCGGDGAALALLNARMRAVDLACLLLAPIFAGALLQGCGLGAAVSALMAYNAAAFWPERALLRAAAAAAPALEARAPAAEARAVVPGWREAARVYVRQPVLAPALALALLYFTVLSLGFLMTSYLHARGVPDVAIAVVRAAGAASGLSATAAFPRLARSRVPLPALATAGVAAQLTWLVIGVVPQLAAPAAKAQSAPLLRLLMAGLALSRFGLWTADLAVSQARFAVHGIYACIADNAFADAAGRCAARGGGHGEWRTRKRVRGLRNGVLRGGPRPAHAARLRSAHGHQLRRRGAVRRRARVVCDASSVREAVYTGFGRRSRHSTRAAAGAAAACDGARAAAGRGCAHVCDSLNNYETQPAWQGGTSTYKHA